MSVPLELTVTVMDMQRVEARTSDRREKSGLVQHDALRANTIRILDNWLRKTSVSRDELEVLGEHLFDTLFQGEVRALLAQCLIETEKGTPLRLQLAFKHEAKALARYPWEYLFWRDDERGHFLSTHARLVLSRFMPSGAGDGPPGFQAARDPDLRILLAIAEPDDKSLGPVAAQPVTDAVEQVAADLTEGKMSIGDGSARLLCSTKVEKLEATTLDGLVEAIETFKPHVVHLIGHGRYDRDKGSGEIALLGDTATRRLRWVLDSVLKVPFLNFDPCPRLVFLHMCQSGAVDFERNFAGLAPQLIGAGVQAVVAMQHPITNAAA
ncbi:MAG TPA: CHAT domain-containing protein, partial [Caldimonas sp.]